VTGAVLVTGGAGYIGSHTAKALAEANLTPVVFDNLGSGHRGAVRWGPFVQGDIRDGRAVRDALAAHQITGVIHFAGLIEVGRSMTRPDLFYAHNVTGTATLLAAMRDAGVGRLVFSSSAAVYGWASGAPAAAVLPETAPKAPASVYGETKLIGERMIEAHVRAFGLSAVALRYFNAAGADADGQIGEAHHPETHLIPLAIEAALGLGRPLTVFGDDYDTPDGSCLRDYIHVADLARAHLAALARPMEAGEFEALNVGTGQGHSVLEVIKVVDAAIGRPTPYVIGPRRPGDPPSLIADARRIRTALNWDPRESSLDHMVETAIRWRRNPGFGLPAPPGG
jgi:UDP-glucose 4-epimerase/UDP-arabinose 4-epimerase